MKSGGIMATATRKRKKKVEVDPIGMLVDDMREHIEYLKGYSRRLTVEDKRAYFFELDGLSIDIDVLHGLVGKSAN